VESGKCEVESAKCQVRSVEFITDEISSVGANYL